MIYFGRVSYEKNIEVLIHALHELLLQKIPATLTITGSGPATDYLKSTAQVQGLEKEVIFQPALKGDELAWHVGQHDVFVTASTIETQGLTVLEAMASGLPCVGADYLGLKDSIKDGFNGYLFKPYDFRDLASKLEKLKSPALRKKLGEGAVRTARKFSVKRMADEAQALYKRVMEK